MARAKPAQWTVVRADLSPEGQAIYDKLVHGWPFWEGTGSTSEDVIGSETFTLDGCTWSTDGDYGDVVAHVAANNPGYLSTFDAPSKGAFYSLIYRDNNGTTEFPILSSGGNHTLIFTGTDACQARFGHTTAEVSGAGFTVNTWLGIYNEWDATADTHELFLDGTSKDSKTSGISDPGSATIQFGKKDPSGFLGEFGCAFEADDHLTAGELANIDKDTGDPWIWCRRWRNGVDGSPAIPAVTAAGGATNHKTASDGTPALTALTAAGTGTNHLSASDGTPGLTAFTASGAATNHLTASDGTATLTAITAAGTATNSLTASDGAPALTPVTAAGTATNHVTASDGTATLTSISAAGTATTHITASDGTPSLTALTAAGTATNNNAITASDGAPALTALLAAGTATNYRTASDGAPTLTALLASGTATNHLTATDGAPSLSAITAAGTATNGLTASDGAPSLAAMIAAGTATAGPIYTIAGGGFGAFYRAPSGRLIQVL